MSVTEGILTNGVTEILKKLVHVVSQEISLAWGVKDELKKLQATIEMILAVVADAERRQVTEEAVRLWLRWLKVVAYDADDVMDEFSYEAIRRSERGSRLKHKVLDFVSSSHNPLAFLFKMAKKIKNINRRLDEITENMHKFQLQSTTPSNPTIAYGESSEQRSRHTTSFSSEPEIVGREDDKNRIINILTSSSTSSAANSEKLAVISLVGMGGLGKTTLAQLVYKDELVNKQFDLTMWIHVSESFDVKNILIKPMESITQTKFDSMSNFDVLVNKVREQLHGKKYLLVLDDVWNEDQEQWEILKSVLLVGAQGSKILITTRKDQFASIVRGTTPPYKLGQLTDDACWSMIEQKAFSPGGAPNTQEMTNIGKEIAKKCGGLPLAAKFLGSLLHSKNKESDWISIRNDDIWNAPEGQRKILPVLKLSYNNLPSDMVELPISVTSLSNLQTLDLNNCELKVIPGSISGLKNLRSLNLSVNPIEELTVSLITLSNLQTLDVSSCKYLKALPKFVAGLTNLRIIDFHNCPLLKTLPEDFGALTQLRYLNLEGTEIRVLPESCTNLKNLEYVDLFWCELPKEVTNWVKLRKLYYKKSGTPMGIGKLVFLQRLTYKVLENVIGEAKCSDGIGELGNLNSLEWLWISNLQNVKDPKDAERANLKGKQNLRRLLLGWKIIAEESGTMRRDQKLCNEVFEALQPPTGLTYLRITNYMGWELPTWMCVPSDLPNLVELKLENCRAITQVPAAIGQLPRLRYLYLIGLKSLKSFDIGSFPNLIQLILTDNFLLEELCYSYPSCLRDMRISMCKSLTKIPGFPSLTILVLNNSNNKLVCSVVATQTSLTELYLENIEDLLYFPISILRSNCNLQILEIKNCNQFHGFDDGNDYKVSLLDPDHYGVSLRKLVFIDCPVLKFLPDLRGWTSLHQLAIFKCPQLKESLTYDLKSLSSLEGLWVDFVQRDEQRGDPSAYEDMINLMNNSNNQ